MVAPPGEKKCFLQIEAWCHLYYLTWLKNDIITLHSHNSIIFKEIHSLKSWFWNISIKIRSVWSKVWPFSICQGFSAAWFGDMWPLEVRMWFWIGLKKFWSTWILHRFFIFYTDFTELMQIGFMILTQFLRNQKTLTTRPCCICNFKMISEPYSIQGADYTPKNYYWHPQILSPSGIPELVLKSGL